MNQSQPKRPHAAVRWTVYVATVVIVAVSTALVMSLFQNIAQRKREAEQVVFSLVDLSEATVDPAMWGKNFPRQYDSYRRTVDVERTRHGGSEAFQKLDEEPVWRTIFAGYGFSIDYREERGHAYMLSDQRETERVTMLKQPGACLHCHSSVVAAYREVGVEKGAPGSLTDPLLSADGLAQLHKGFETVCAMPYEEATQLVEHPVTCLDCHDPKTNELRITRPAFLTGMARLAESSDPLPHLPSVERWRQGDRRTPYDPNALATRQEMRSLACAQCHVEYYFKGEGKLLVYPWHHGLKAEQIERYYDDSGYADWTHKESGAKVLKAQHPEFELWSQGIHARSGVSCADCHMPYKREGAIKVSDHQIRSPLLNIARACQTCHRYSEEEILARAELIQDRNRKMLDRASGAVVDLIEAIRQAREAGAGEDSLSAARLLQRKAQWRLDFVAAENSMGFHAAQEAARLLGEAIDYARQGEIDLARSPQSEN